MELRYSIARCMVGMRVRQMTRNARVQRVAKATKTTHTLAICSHRRVAWSRLLWWLSLLALIEAALGACVGILRIKVRGSRLVSLYTGTPCVASLARSRLHAVRADVDIQWLSVDGRRRAVFRRTSPPITKSPLWPGRRTLQAALPFLLSSMASMPQHRIDQTSEVFASFAATIGSSSMPRTARYATNSISRSAPIGGSLTHCTGSIFPLWQDTRRYALASSSHSAPAASF